LSRANEAISFLAPSWKIGLPPSSPNISDVRGDAAQGALANFHTLNGCECGGHISDVVFLAIASDPDLYMASAFFVHIGIVKGQWATCVGVGAQEAQSEGEQAGRLKFACWGHVDGLLSLRRRPNANTNAKAFPAVSALYKNT
jgi:hypothetical protein